MLNQIRIVSTKSPFPIWINNQPIRLKLSIQCLPLFLMHVHLTPYSLSILSSVSFLSLFPSLIHSPHLILLSLGTSSDFQSLSWLLLAKDAFVNLHITPADAPTSPVPPDRSESSLSEESNQSVQNQQPSFTTKNNRPFRHRLTTSDGNISTVNLCNTIDRFDSLSTNDGDLEKEEEEGLVGKFLSSSINAFGLWLQRTKSPDSDMTSGTGLSSELHSRSSHLSLGSPQDGDRPPLSQRSLSPSRSYTCNPTGGGGGGGGGHIKQHSWSGQSDFELHVPDYPPAASLPLSLSVRVQTLKPEVAHKIWGQDNVYDVYVNPLSLPHHHHNSTNSSFLVRISLCTPPSVPQSTNNTTTTTGTSSKGKQTMPEQLTGNASSTSLQSNKSSIFERISNLMPDRNTPSPTLSATPLPVAPPSSETPTTSSYYCTTALAHLHLVTHIPNEQRKLSILSHTIEEVSQSREASNSPAHSPASVKKDSMARRIGGIAVLPGHVVLGSLMCQQLGASPHSYVLIEEVKEDWRVDVKRNKISVTLDLLAPFKVCLLLSMIL